MASAASPRHGRSHDLPPARPVVPPNGPVSVGTLLRREGRAAHSLDRPVVPRARDAADDDTRRSHRAAVTAGALLAVTAVLGTNVLSDLTRPPATKADEGAERDGRQAAVAPPALKPPLASSPSAADPLGQAVAALRTAGSPASTAVGGGTSGLRPASGAGIVAQALRQVPPLVGGATGSAATAVPALGQGSSTSSERSSSSSSSSGRSSSDGSSSDRSSSDGSSSIRSSGSRSSTDESSERVSRTAPASSDRDGSASDGGNSNARTTPSPRPRVIVPAFAAGEPTATPPSPPPADTGSEVGEVPAPGASEGPTTDNDTSVGDGETPDAPTGTDDVEDVEDVEDVDGSAPDGLSPDETSSDDASSDDASDSARSATEDVVQSVAGSTDTDDAPSTGRHAAPEDSSTDSSADSSDDSDSSGDAGSSGSTDSSDDGTDTETGADGSAAA